MRRLQNLRNSVKNLFEKYKNNEITEPKAEKNLLFF